MAGRYTFVYRFLVEVPNYVTNPQANVTKL
jgi:hypothetical protein